MGKNYWNNGCGCENNGADEAMSMTAGCGCENNDCGCAANTGYENSKRCKKHGHQPCGCGGEEGTHVYFEACDGCKEIAITGECQQDAAIGRTLDVNCTLHNVCPGRRSALGLTLTEVDENGAEYARGFQAVTVPAHNGRCNQDVEVDTVRFILPEDLSLQSRRHFIVRTQHHYLDAGNIWNNRWNQ